MKSTHVGKAILEPNSLSPKEEKSSVPIQTVATKLLWKPENHVLIASLVVPVFPAISLRFNTLTFFPLVPLERASRRISFVIKVILGSIGSELLFKGGKR